MWRPVFKRAGSVASKKSSPVQTSNNSDEVKEAYN
jgi:hypothetical protein